MVFQRSFQFFHTAYIGPSRALVQGSAKFQQFVLRPGGIHFHAPVIQVTGKTVQPKGQCPSAHKVSKADAVYAPAHEPAPSLHLS